MNSIHKLLKIWLVVCLAMNANLLRAQGCSDAGFCTAGSVKPGDTNPEKVRSALGFSFGFGMGEQGTMILTPQFEPEIKVSDKSMVQIKVPFVMVKGEGFSTKGLGDVILTYNYNLDTSFRFPIALTIGTRIGTGTSAIKGNNISLPMPYQTSLGTTDLILGAKINLKKGFSIAIGYQQPIVQKNQNGFDSSAFYLVEAQTQKTYFLSSNLKRAGDLMMRIDKSFNKPKMQYNIGLLPIYHLGEDKISYGSNEEISLKGSAGLTLNFTGSIIRKLSDDTSLSFAFGAPLIVRESRPDGLTRAFVGVLGIKHKL